MAASASPSWNPSVPETWTPPAPPDNFVSHEALDNELAAGWSFHTLHDAYQDRPPIREVVSSVILEGSLNLWYGAPGSKKSLIVADLCACVAAGMDWLQPIQGSGAHPANFSTIAVPVLWLDFDNGTRRTHDRMAAFGRAYDLPPSTPLRYISMPSPWLDAGNRRMIENLARLIEAERFGFLVVDNLGVIIGDAEENSSEMAVVMSNLRWLCNSTGAAINVIHHQRKSGTNGSAEGRVGKIEAIRGHSSISASLDMAYHVESEGSDVIVTPAKQRDYDAFDQLACTFTYEHKPGTFVLDKARFFANNVGGKAAEIKSLIRTAIRNVIARNPGISQTSIIADVRAVLSVDGTPPSQSRVRGELLDLIERGIVYVREDVAETDRGRKNGHFLQNV